MLEALDNINRSQDYLVNELGLRVLCDNYEEFRQFIVENDQKKFRKFIVDDREEYENFYKYLVDNNKPLLEKGFLDKYHYYKIKDLQYYGYRIKIGYEYYVISKSHYHTLKISNHNTSLVIRNYGFSFVIKNDIMLGYNQHHDFKYFCENFEDGNHIFVMGGLINVNDILDKIDCEFINELDPILYKMFMTIFNKPKMKNANNISVDNKKKLIIYYFEYTININ